jgi:hypothetical protein
MTTTTVNPTTSKKYTVANINGTDLRVTNQTNYPSEPAGKNTYLAILEKDTSGKLHQEIFLCDSITGEVLCKAVGLHAPKKYIATDLTNVAKLEMDALELKLKPSNQVDGLMEIEKENVKLPKGAKTTATTGVTADGLPYSVFVKNEFAYLVITDGQTTCTHLLKAPAEQYAAKPIEKAAKPQKAATDAATATKPAKVKAEKKAPAEMAEKAATATKPATITFEEFNAMIADGKVTTKKGEKVVEAAWFQPEDQGRNGWAKVKIEGKTKPWETALPVLNRYYNFVTA